MESNSFPDEDLTRSDGEEKAKTDGFAADCGDKVSSPL